MTDQTLAVRPDAIEAGLVAAREVVRREARAVAALSDRVGDEFARAVELVAGCRGRVVVTGLGKSGRVGRKIAATLASTGSPSFFVHATEALHGDAGMVTQDDVVIAISNSGETDEVCRFIDVLIQRGAALIAMTGNCASTLARTCDVSLDIGVDREADPLGIVPTSSTTTTIAMGDALAVAVMVQRGVTHADFHRNHPGGSLGTMLAASGNGQVVSSADVCVVGSFMLDLVVGTKRRPAPGETVFGESFDSFLGGKGFNQAIAAVRSGATASMVGRLGADEFGDRFRATLESEGIDAAHVAADASTGTGVGLPVIDADGSNSIIVVPRANLRVQPTDVECAAAAIAGAKVVLMQLELPVESLVAAARIARAAGKTVVLNPAPANDEVHALARLVDVLVPNEVEAEQLSGIVCDGDGAVDAARALLSSFDVAAVVVTLGERGSVLVNADVAACGASEPVWFGPHEVRAVDTVGAGDAFAGALAAGIARGLELADAVRYANAAGALAVTVPGAEPSMPRNEAVLALLEHS